MSLRLDEVLDFIHADQAQKGCGEDANLVINIDGHELFIKGVEYAPFHDEIRLNACEPDAVPQHRIAGLWQSLTSHPELWSQ